MWVYAPYTLALKSSRARGRPEPDTLDYCKRLRSTQDKPHGKEGLWSYSGNLRAQCEKWDESLLQVEHQPTARVSQNFQEPALLEMLMTNSELLACPNSLSYIRNRAVGPK